MPAVKNVGEPCAGEPHARIEVAAGGNQAGRANTCRAAQAPPADPTTLFRMFQIDVDDLVAAGSLAPSRSTEQATPRTRHRRPIGRRR